jgi:glycine oxidase
VGFDRSNTPSVVEELLGFALEMVPELSGAALERCWSGLRPATADGLPYMGPIPGLDNAFIAAGHYRSGLQLSPGTAVLMSQLIRGKTPDIDLSSFRVDR